MKVPHRIIFWNIEGQVWFYLFSAVAVVCCLGALCWWWIITRRGGVGKSPLTRRGMQWTGLALDVLLGRRLWRGDISAGIFHLLMAWGFVLLFIGTVLVAIHHYLIPFLTGNVYLYFSFILDAAGLGVLIGCLWALIRRMRKGFGRTRVSSLQTVLTAWLCLITMSGFLVEAGRLALSRPEWGKWSFAGWFLSQFMAFTVPRHLWYRLFWWSHAILSLSFIAYFFWTPMVHLLAAPLNLYLYHRNRSVGAALITVPQQVCEVLEKATDATLYEPSELFNFLACTNCRRCDEVCPANQAGEPLRPHDIVAQMRSSLNLDGLLYVKDKFPTTMSKRISKLKGQKPGKAVWFCTTCAACSTVCPVAIPIPEVIRRERVRLLESGFQVPTLLTTALERVYNYHNPWQSSRRKRDPWLAKSGPPTMEAGLREADKASPSCVFTDCTTGFDTRCQKIGESFSGLLQLSQTAYYVMHGNTPCCGEIAYTAGEWGLFLEIEENMRNRLEQEKATVVVTGSPHCYHTMSGRSGSLTGGNGNLRGAQIEVQHSVQVLNKLLSDGAIPLPHSISLTVTYHDPCYLGRYHGIIQEPRNILNSIPGLRLVEMEHHGLNSLCCGGGGGRLWQDEPLNGGMLAQRRLQEAWNTGAEVLLTACPLCLLMLEAAQKSAEPDVELEIMDISELLVKIARTVTAEDKASPKKK